MDKLARAPGKKNWLLHNLTVAVVYSLLAKIGLFFAINPGNITIFWPAGGFALAILLLHGPRSLPGIYAGGFLAGLMVDASLPVSALMALGNTLESFCGFWLLGRYCNINRSLNRTADFGRLLFFGATLSTILSALFGPTALLLTDVIDSSLFTPIFLRWWMADALGIAFAAPLILIWSGPPRLTIALERPLEMAALFISTFLIGQATFLDWFDRGNWEIEPSWILPFVIWAGLRAGRHLTALLQLMLFIQSIWGASRGVGYYADDLAQNGLINFWLFGMIIALGGMVLALLSFERRLATKEQELLHKTIAASLNEIYLFNAGTLRFTFVNRGALENLGYTLEEMKALTPLDLKPSLTFPQFQDLIAPLLNHEAASISFETIHKRKDGSLYPVEVHLQLFEDEGERYFNAVILNIAERKQTEQALLEAKCLAEESARLKSEFLANMSHEIRTPMNAIVGISELVLNQEVSPNVRQYLEKIRQASDNLLGILNDILDFSKAESKRISIEKNHFNLDDMLNNLNDLFMLRAQEKQIAFTIQASTSVPRELVGDALRIQQILTNLLSNAIKFTQRGSVSLTIALKQLTNRHALLEFCVEDTGIGMSEHDIGKLFQPFSQVDGSITRRFGGTGLGLAISHRLLQLMDSHFQVHSTPGIGSRFSFELDLSIPYGTLNPQHRDKKSRQAGTLTSKLSEAGKTLAGTRILVAEDNETNRLIIKDMLELTGAIVETAVNGKQALDLLNNSRFDAVLMDVHMPEMGGIEATQRIRQQPRFNDLPVIALTAGVTRQERENCLASGVNDFVAKPFNAETLAATLVQWLKG
jgi:PAS domain S-box-containing protein